MSVIDRDDMTVADLAALSLGSRSVSYTERDAILYALAVGARAHELDFVYERQLKVLSTYALALGLWAVEAAGRTGVYDPVRTLHVSQRLVTHAPLPPAGEIAMQAHIASVWDKKAAALLEVVVSSEYFDASYGIWIPGAGGFGGERGPSAGPEPDVTTGRLQLEVQTSPDQAAVYRLTGDRHPLHIDPQVAAAAGFERPILHGLCVLGTATLALSRAAEVDPAAVRELSVRFAAPVYPGAAIHLDSSSPADNEPMRFSASVGEAAVLKSGEITFGSPA